MANKRNLKKNINYITNLASGLCIVESLDAPKEKQDALQDLFIQCATLRKDIISRISHAEPGNIKGFYKKLKSDFHAQIDSIFEKLQELDK